MKGYFYDVELFPNLFTVTFIPINKDFPLSEYIRFDKIKDQEGKFKLLASLGSKFFILNKDVNNLIELENFIRSTSLLVGFNNRSYDDNVLDYICIKLSTFKKLTNDLILSDLYEFSTSIISEIFNRWTDYRFKRYVQPYRSVDLYKILRLDYSFTGLKQIAVKLKWYRVQDLPYEFNATIESSKVVEVLDYNINDVLITRELYFTEIAEVIQRFEASAIYGLDFLASSRSVMADRILSKLYCEQTDIKPWELKNLPSTPATIHFNSIISPRFKFKSEELSIFLSRVKRTILNVYHGGKFKEDLIFGGTSYTFAKGGIHSNDKPGIFNSDDRYVYIDADVTSFYPRLIINNVAVPKHLDPGIFLSIFKMLVEERIVLKRAGNSLADIYKILINSIYGKLGEETGWLYDLNAMYKVTINGQLVILHAIETLHLNGFNVISANTDGFVTKVPMTRLDEYYEICGKWCDESGYELEYTIFDKYVRLSVNDYIVKKDDGNFKNKGFFNTKFDPVKGFNMPVIPKALIAYFFDKVKPSDFIRNHTDIYDFCASIKTGEQFYKELLKVSKGELRKESLPKTIRYYCSNSGGTLIKSYVDKDKSINMLKGKKITIINDHFDDKYDIDYGFYIKQVYELIYRISNVVHKDIRGTKTKSGISGKLFDDIEY